MRWSAPRADDPFGRSSSGHPSALFPKCGRCGDSVCLGQVLGRRVRWEELSAYRT